MEKDHSIKFLFETDAWRECGLQSIVLSQVFRQRDSAFISLLDEMRKARLTPFSVAQIRHHVAHPPQLFRPPSFIPTYGEAAAAPAASVKEEAKLQVSGGESSSAAGPVSATAGSAAVGGALMSLPSHLSTRLFARNEDSEHENNGRLDALCHGEGAKLMIWLSKDVCSPLVSKPTRLWCCLWCCPRSSRSVELSPALASLRPLRRASTAMSSPASRQPASRCASAHR